MRRMFTEKQVEDIAKSVAPSESDIQEAVANVDDGTIAESIGLDSDGKLVKGEISSSSKVYLHLIQLNINAFRCSFHIYSTSSTAFTRADLINYLYNKGFTSQSHVLLGFIPAGYSSASSEIVLNIGLYSDSNSSLTAVRRRISGASVVNDVVSFNVELSDYTVQETHFKGDNVTEI